MFLYIGSPLEVYWRRRNLEDKQGPVHKKNKQQLLLYISSSISCSFQTKIRYSFFMFNTEIIIIQFAFKFV